MELSPEQFERIRDCLPRQRGNVSIDNLTLLNALLFVLENGCKWRALPRQFGRWHTVYLRLSRWSRSGVIERVFARLQAEQILALKIEAVGLDSTSVKVHADGTGARKKTVRSPSAGAAAGARPKFIWSPRLSVAR